jgi:DtxR family Mn-dependent transcriptional regulator
MPPDKSILLSELRPTQTATITRVISSDPELLRYLDGLGMVPGAQIEITDYSPFDQNLTIKVGRKSFVLGLSITGKVFVEEYE